MAKPTCAICNQEIEHQHRPFQVCGKCDTRAVNASGESPRTDQDDTEIKMEGNVVLIEDGGDGGENPVFIDGMKCWRLYKYGGWITSMDPFDCETMEEFERKA